MATTEAHKRANAKWDKIHMTTVGVRVTRELATVFGHACTKLGKTKGQILREAILNAIAEAKQEERN